MSSSSGCHCVLPLTAPCSHFPLPSPTNQRRDHAPAVPLLTPKSPRFPQTYSWQCFGKGTTENTYKLREARRQLSRGLGVRAPRAAPPAAAPAPQPRPPPLLTGAAPGRGRSGVRAPCRKTTCTSFSSRSRRSPPAPSPPPCAAAAAAARRRCAHRARPPRRPRRVPQPMAAALAPPVAGGTAARRARRGAGADGKPSPPAGSGVRPGPGGGLQPPAGTAPRGRASRGGRRALLRGSRLRPGGSGGSGGSGCGGFVPRLLGRCGGRHRLGAGERWREGLATAFSSGIGSAVALQPGFVSAAAASSSYEGKRRGRSLRAVSLGASAPLPARDKSFQAGFFPSDFPLRRQE